MRHALIPLLSLLLASTAMRGQTRALVNIGVAKEGDNLTSLRIGTGSFQTCALLQPDMLTAYAGCKVVGARFAVGSSELTGVRVWLSEDPSSDVVPDLCTASATSLTEGWNYIEFPQGYTLTGQEAELYLGYDFTTTSDDQPSLLLTSTKSTYGFLLVEDGRWYDYSSYGTLAVQLVVEASLPDYDASLSNLFTDARYYKADGTLRLVADLASTGAKALPGVDIKLSFDGQDELGGTLKIEEEVSGTMQLPLELQLSQFNLPTGKHTLTLKALSASDGSTLSDLTAGDDSVSTTLYIYKEAKERKASLMEVFASTDSYYDSRFTAPLEEFLADRDDVIPVFIYGSFSGDDVTALSAQGTDDLAATAGVASAPSFGFNRTAAPQADYFLYEHTNDPQPEDFTELLNYLNASTPAFADISIDAQYVPETRLLKLNVKGERSADFRTFFSYGALTVYLTEDGVEGHNHVLRKIVTPTFGSMITNWNAQGSFSKDFRIVLDEAWEPRNMHAVAFITKLTASSTKHENMEVTAAASLPLFDILPDGIVSPIEEKEADSPMFDLSGRNVRWQEARPGIYVQAGRKLIKK